MHYVIINGKPGVGKDTFVNLFKNYVGTAYVKNLSTVDKVKEAATLFGWDGSKTPKNRKFLSDLKDLTDAWGNCSIKYIINSCEGFKRELEIFDLDSNGWVFIHCREPKNIDELAKKLGAITLYIERDLVGNEFGNHADADTEDYNYSCVIKNNGDLDALENEAKRFYKENN